MDRLGILHLRKVWDSRVHRSRDTETAQGGEVAADKQGGYLLARGHLPPDNAITADLHLRDGRGEDGDQAQQAGNYWLDPEHLQLPHWRWAAHAAADARAEPWQEDKQRGVAETGVFQEG